MVTKTELIFIVSSIECEGFTAKRYIEKLLEDLLVKNLC